MAYRSLLALIGVAMMGLTYTNKDSARFVVVPHITQEVIIDGKLDEWKHDAFQDGTWTLDRVRSAPWFEPKRNRLVVDEGESEQEVDLEASYYLAWNEQWLYLGAEVKDNVNDVMDASHEPKRWYYKDAIAFFLEVPKDTLAEKFGEGDHAFCFVADTSMPSYGAWWRHGSAETTYIEEPMPAEAVEYAVRMNPWNRSPADFVLEARIDMAALTGSVDRSKDCGFMIVHCDPDGGEYGGHLLIYGKGDDDNTWGTLRFEPADAD